MGEKFKRLGYMLISDIRRLIGIYKIYIIVFAIIFLISFITGIMTCINYSSSISTDNFINVYLLSYLKKDTSYISYFLMLGLYLLIITLFVIFFTRNVFFVIVDGVVLVLTSYIFGFDTCIFVMTMGLAGVIFGVLIYGLLLIVVFLGIIVILSIACRRLKDRKNVCEVIENSQYWKMYLIFTILTIATLFIHSILLGIIHIFVIVD